MAITKGDKVPDATLLKVGAEGPEPVELGPKLKGRKVVLFGVPGAFTGTCTNAHVPSFMRNMDALKAKGVDEVICVAVNDPFVVQAWGESTGATEAGITMLADPGSEFVKAIGMNFSAPPVGFYDRSARFASFVDDGEVKVLQIEESPGVCDMSSGETMVEAI